MSSSKSVALWKTLQPDSAPLFRYTTTHLLEAVDQVGLVQKMKTYPSTCFVRDFVRFASLLKIMSGKESDQNTTTFTTELRIPIPSQSLAVTCRRSVEKDENVIDFCQKIFFLLSNGEHKVKKKTFELLISQLLTKAFGVLLGGSAQDRLGPSSFDPDVEGTQRAMVDPAQLATSADIVMAFEGQNPAESMSAAEWHSLRCHGEVNFKEFAQKLLDITLHLCVNGFAFASPIIPPLLELVDLFVFPIAAQIHSNRSGSSLPCLMGPPSKAQSEGAKTVDIISSMRRNVPRPPRPPLAATPRAVEPLPTLDDVATGSSICTLTGADVEKRRLVKARNGKEREMPPFSLSKKDGLSITGSGKLKNLVTLLDAYPLAKKETKRE